MQLLPQLPKKPCYFGVFLSLPQNIHSRKKHGRIFSQIIGKQYIEATNSGLHRMIHYFECSITLHIKNDNILNSIVIENKTTISQSLINW